MSTLITSNISDGTETVGTEYVVNGSAKVHVGFDASTNVLFTTLNVSSLTDLGVGQHTVNFTNNMTTSAYTIVLGSTGPINTHHTHAYLENPLTGSYTHAQFRDENSTNRADGLHYGTVHGDLA